MGIMPIIGIALGILTLLAGLTDYKRERRRKGDSGRPRASKRPATVGR
jgi:hypothetical protein